MRNDAEIRKEISWLKSNKSKIQRISFFGDDNWAKIEAEITVLEERLTEDDIWDRTEQEGEENDSKEWDFETGESARDAARWLAGESDESPSSDWKYLVKED